MTWLGSPQHSFPNDYENWYPPIIFFTGGFSENPGLTFTSLPINMVGKSHNVPMNFMVNPLAWQAPPN